MFEAMVGNECLEAIENKANLDLPQEVGRAFVKSIYTGEFEEEILTKQAAAFLELGEMFDIQELKDSAKVELLRLLDKDNMVEFLSIGHVFHVQKISEAAFKMTKANMKWLSHTKMAFFPHSRFGHFQCPK